MAYVTKDDFAFRIQRKMLDDLISQCVRETDLDGDQLLSQNYLHAEEEIKSFLRDVWDIDTELALNHDDPQDTRNRLILKCYLDIVIYNLHKTIAPSDVPETRQVAYDECRMMLDAMRDERINPGLTRIEDGTEVTKTKIVSNTKFIFHPHDDMASGNTQVTPVNPLNP